MSDALDGFVIDPTPTAEGEAAAIICGHDFLHGRCDEDVCSFHGFVQEVLSTTVGAEIARLTRERDDSCESLMRVAEILGCQATAFEPAERARLLLRDNEVLRARLEQLAAESEGQAAVMFGISGRARHGAKRAECSLCDEQRTPQGVEHMLGSDPTRPDFPTHGVKARVIKRS